MAATSFQYKYPLSRAPYTSDQNAAIMYPYQNWSSNYSSGNFYLDGRNITPPSYFEEDLNLSARPITRVIQPHVLEYAPLSCPFHGANCNCKHRQDTRMAPMSIAPIVASPVLNNRFAALGAQVGPSRNTLVILLVILALAGFLGFAVFRKSM